MMKNKLLVLLSLCGGFMQTIFAESSEKRIMVIADPHILADGIITGSQGSGKCDPISEIVFDQAMELLKSAKPDILLIPGDMTYTGEASAHTLMAEKLAVLKDLGIQAYVIPGNHDIFNLNSLDEDHANVSPEEFKNIYADYGYSTTDGTLFDKQSLSWAKSVSNDLAIIGLDGCIYSDEKYFSEGCLRRSTLEWMKSCAKEFTSKGQMVIAMVHHNIMDHFDGQSVSSPDQVLNAEYKTHPFSADDENEVNSAMIGEAFKDAGIHYVFTGHTHSGDVSVREIGDEKFKLYDITTGSLLSYPNTIRTVKVDASEKTLEWATSYIQMPINVRQFDTDFTDLKSYSLAELDKLTSSMGQSTFGSLASLFSSTLCEMSRINYYGDEDKFGGPELYDNIEKTIELANNPFLQTQYLKAKAVLPGIKSMLYNTVEDSLSVEDNPSCILYDGCLFDTDSSTYLGLEYARYFGDTLWQALYVPFDLNYEEIPTGLQVAELKDVDGGKLIFESLTAGSTLPANTIALVKASDNGMYTFKKADDFTVNAAPSTPIIYGDIILFGTYSGLTGNKMLEETYMSLERGKIGCVDPSAENLENNFIKPMRWYLKNNAVGENITISVDDKEISDAQMIVSLEKDTNSPSYTVTGQKITGTPSPGTIYIQNNQKKIAR